MAGKCPRGFTLIEVILATTVFVIVMGACLYSLGMLSRLMDRTNQAYAPLARRFATLRRSVGGMRPYIIRQSGQGRRKEQCVLFFDAKKDELRYVTNYPIWEDEPVIVWLREEEGSLLMTEIPLFGGEIDYQAPSFPKGIGVTGVLLEDCGSLRVHALRADQAGDVLPRAIRFELPGHDPPLNWTIAIRNTNVDALRRRQEYLDVFP
jgi:prepilin-type N-terminal cleavage/methylation domain-containing protein